MGKGILVGAGGSAKVDSYSKEETLSEDTKELFGLDENTVPDEAFNVIMNKVKKSESELAKTGDVVFSVRPEAPGPDWCLANGARIVDESLATITGNVANVDPKLKQDIASNLNESIYPIIDAVGNGYFLFYIGNTSRIGYAPISAIENGSIDFFRTGVNITSKFIDITNSTITEIIVRFVNGRFVFQTRYNTGGNNKYKCGSFTLPTDESFKIEKNERTTPELYTTSYVAGDYIIQNNYYYKVSDSNWYNTKKGFNYKCSFNINGTIYGEYVWYVDTVRYIDGEYYLGLYHGFLVGSTYHGYIAIAKCEELGGELEYLYESYPENKFYSCRMSTLFKNENDLYFLYFGPESTNRTLNFCKVSNGVFEQICSVGKRTNTGQVKAYDVGDYIIFLWDEFYTTMMQNVPYSVHVFNRRNKTHTLKDGTYTTNLVDANYPHGHYIQEDGTVSVFLGKPNNNSTARYLYQAPVIRSALPSISVENNTYAYIKYTDEVIEDDSES